MPLPIHVDDPLSDIWPVDIFHRSTAGGDASMVMSTGGGASVSWGRAGGGASAAVSTGRDGTIPVNLMKADVYRSSVKVARTLPG
jgi:hypothetical protein